MWYNKEWSINMSEESVTKDVTEEKEDVMPFLSTVRDWLNGLFSKSKKEPVELEKPVEMIDNAVVPVKKENQMFIWKENDYYRWFALYSNCYRDNDNPPEIISKESHKKFVEMVDNKEVPYPELWHWHLKGSKYGQADWVAFDEDNGFAMASGYILPGHEQEAELMASKDLCVSHGMPSSSIVRDNTDKSVIIRHITAEISDLPTWAAANQLTQFSVFTKEIDETMTIPDNKKEYLKAVGLSDDKITQIENAAVNGKERADAEQRDSKEKTAEVTPVEPPVAEVKEVVTPNYVTKEEVAQAVGDVVAELAKSIKDMVDQMTALNARIIENEKKNKESVNLTPAASLSAMILGRAESAVGSKETLVRSNSPLLKDGPMEMQVADSGEGNDTSQIMNSIIRGIIAPKK